MGSKGGGESGDGTELVVGRMEDQGQVVIFGQERSWCNCDMSE
jgi:hypothetical protein